SDGFSAVSTGEQTRRPNNTAPVTVQLLGLIDFPPLRLTTFLTLGPWNFAVFQPAGTSPRYNHATQAKPQSRDTSRSGGHKSLPTTFVFLRNCSATMSEQSRPSYEFGPFYVDAGK